VLLHAAAAFAIAFAPSSCLIAGESDGGGDKAPGTQPADTSGGTTGYPSKGKQLFVNWACGACHALADAGATGQVGPPLDGNPNLTDAAVVNRITYGQNAMPAYGGQMSDEDIADIAAYILQFAAK